MADQRLSEWTDFDEKQLFYHTNQWNEPKDSTRAFYDFIKHKLENSSSVIDLGAGAGSATSFIAEKSPKVSFTAADYVRHYLDIGKELSSYAGITNLTFREIDWFNLSEVTEFDGVISLQTISWLPELRKPLEQVFLKIKPDWFAMTSLFYPGDISCTIEVLEHTNHRKTFYNIYSMMEVQRIASEFNYRLSKFEKFEISIDLPKPSNTDLMGTYTENLVRKNGKNERLQISGPLLMPWYMLLIERMGD